MNPHRTSSVTSRTASVVRRTLGTAAAIGALALVGFSPSAFAGNLPEAGPIGEGPMVEPAPVEVVDLVGDAVMPDASAGVSQTAANQLAVPAATPVVASAAAAVPMLPATGSSALLIEAAVASALVGLGFVARRTAAA